MTTTLAISSGCPNGIGLELLFPAVHVAGLAASTRLRFCGPPSLLEVGAARANVPVDVSGDTVYCGPMVFECDPPQALAAMAPRAWVPGKPDADSLVVQRESLVHAIALAQRGEVDGIVTLPIRKRALDDVDGQRYPGHTELLSDRLHDGEGPALMVFAQGPFLLGLATVHVPIAEVSAHITQANIVHALSRLLDATRRYSGKSRPRVVVFGHNPHAGEGGLLGLEERNEIAPAIQAFIEAHGADVTGPVPADGFFAHFRANPPDAVLAMHHDQGLGPYKILAEGRGVNVTWGLRCVRTSPDHGTADDIAGTNTGDPSSLAGAFQLGERMAARL